VRRALAAALVVVLVGSSVHADERRAREHFDEGESLYAAGDFDAALAEYLAAFAEEPLPAFLFNVGQCHRNLDHYDAAIFSFKRYLALAPDAPNREAVLRLIVELEEKRARAAPPPPRRDLVPAPVAVKTSPAHPFYTSWWFITGVVVAGAAVTGAVLLSSDHGGGDNGIPASDFGNVELPK
jgi:tetratricopeptide (TPR) repeat protein